MGSGSSKESKPKPKKTAKVAPAPIDDVQTVSSTNKNYEQGTEKAAATTPPVADERVATYTDEFTTLCQNIFKIADVNGDGVLDFGEFDAAFSSKTLSLGLSATEMQTLNHIADSNKDGVVDFKEFQFLVKNLKPILSEVYETEAETDDANDWCLYKSFETQEALYLNKRTGEERTKKPKAYHTDRQEALEFEYFVLDDGTEISIHTDESGKRMYMDWDLGSWAPVPEEWNDMIDEQQQQFNDQIKSTVASGDDKPGVLRKQKSVVGTDSNPLIKAKNNQANATKTTMYKKDTDDNGRDERMGVFEHHSKGRFHTFLFENQRNTRLFFDDTDGQWVRMPLSWERNVPEVQTMLEEIDANLPHWKNVNEQLLTLRECNYEVTDAIAFGEINFGYVADDKKNDGGLAANMTRTARRRTTTMKSTALIGVEGDGLGRLSSKAAKYIADLEKDLADARKRLDSIEETESDLRNEVGKMKREATSVMLVQNTLESTKKEEDERHKALTSKVNSQRLRIEELEKQLAAAEVAKPVAETSEDEVAELRKQLAQKSTMIATLKAEAEKFDLKDLISIQKKVKELLAVKNDVGSVRSEFAELEANF